MRASPLSTLLALAAAARLDAGPLTDGTQLFGTGFPELSAAAPAGPANSWLVVADNELPRLGLFNLSSFPASQSAPALRATQSGTLEVDDLEAVTIFPWDIDGDSKPEASYHVFAASCARTRGKGRVEPLRDALFAVRINPDAPPASAFPDAASIEYNRTLRSQIRSLGAEHAAEPWGPILRNSVHSPGTQPDAPFQLFTWNGNPDNPPEPIVSPASSTATSRSPEAIAVAPAWPAALIFSDGGSKLPFFRGTAVAPPPP